MTFIFLMGAIFSNALAFSEIESAQPIDHFSTQGVVMHTDPAKKAVYVKTEGGLELTFFISDATVIMQGKEAKLFTDLKPENEIKIEYDYNADYEKFARSIEVKSGAS